MISVFEDSKKLSEAVSRANIPNELMREISKRASKKGVGSESSMDDRKSPSAIIRALNHATNDQGVLTIQSLTSELSRLQIEETSAEHIIGQAELEGILVRTTAESWSWLQQSS